MRTVLCVPLAVRDGEDSVVCVSLAVRDGEDSVVCATSSEGW